MKQGRIGGRSRSFQGEGEGEREELIFSLKKSLRFCTVKEEQWEWRRFQCGVKGHKKVPRIVGTGFNEGGKVALFGKESNHLEDENVPS